MTTEGTDHGDSWYEYKVVATVEHKAKERAVNDTEQYDMKSAWIDDKEMAANIANAMRADGHAVEIQTRKRGSYQPTEFGLMPEWVLNE